MRYSLVTDGRTDSGVLVIGSRSLPFGERSSDERSEAKAPTIPDVDLPGRSQCRSAVNKGLDTEITQLVRLAHQRTAVKRLSIFACIGRRARFGNGTRWVRLVGWSVVSQILISPICDVFHGD
ncbi:hypothetical protein EVAR_47631_1 [Eumeta japonica]|uniref:Uncharacterized protein n=1 Tax=Eumeta variegata TaxID=151549 RepID=A0A4C1ZF41_EUMVA|nr:hypothetical protein EVAR_47631_1 [Eumeta japonica]